MGNMLLSGSRWVLELVLWQHNRITAWLLDDTRFIDKNQLSKANSTINIHSYNVHQLNQLSIQQTPSNSLKSLPQNPTYLENTTTNCNN